MLIFRILWPALLSVLLFLSGAVFADLYRWVDENGKVHYTDTPPPGNARKSKKLQTPSAVAPSVETEDDAQQAPSYVEKEAEFRKRQVEKAEQQAAQAREKQEADDKKNNCNAARSRLATLQAGGRIARYDAQGEREILGDKEIQDGIASAKNEIEAACK